MAAGPGAAGDSQIQLIGGEQGAGQGGEEDRSVCFRVAPPGWKGMSGRCRRRLERLKQEERLEERD